MPLVLELQYGLNAWSTVDWCYLVWALTMTSLFYTLISLLYTLLTLPSPVFSTCTNYLKDQTGTLSRCFPTYFIPYMKILTLKQCTRVKLLQIIALGYKGPRWLAIWQAEGKISNVPIHYSQGTDQESCLQPDVQGLKTWSF